MQSILIIGGGNMGGALASRWRAAFKDATITVIDPDAKKRAAFIKQGIAANASLGRYKASPTVVVLAIKPQSSLAVIDQLRAARAQYRDAILVSIMAGVKLEVFSGIGRYAVRAMPNTPAMIGQGMSVLYAPKLPSQHRNPLRLLFAAVGAVAWVETEKELHAVTAISGSGPAYLFAFMEALMKAGESLGLSPLHSRILVTQTMKGSALLADAKDGQVRDLRKAVTSPSGTTEAALKAFKKGKLERLVKQAAKTAEKRSRKLAES
jgi:pyrroline-5-carboxylate reductase